MTSVAMAASAIRGARRRAWPAAVGLLSSAFRIRFIRNSGYGGGMRLGLGEAGLLSRARSLHRTQSKSCAVFPPDFLRPNELMPGL